MKPIVPAVIPVSAEAFRSTLEKLKFAAEIHMMLSKEWHARRVGKLETL